MFCGRIFKEILHNRLSLTRGLTWVSVHGSYCSNIELTYTLLSVLLGVFPVKTNEWEEAFFWPTAVSDLCCDTIETEPRPRLRLKNLKLKHLHRRTKNPPAVSPTVPQRFEQMYSIGHFLFVLFSALCRPTYIKSKLWGTYTLIRIFVHAAIYK